MVMTHWPCPTKTNKTNNDLNACAGTHLSSFPFGIWFTFHNRHITNGNCYWIDLFFFIIVLIIEHARHTRRALHTRQTVFWRSHKKPRNRDTHQQKCAHGRVVASRLFQGRLYICWRYFWQNNKDVFNN